MDRDQYILFIDNHCILCSKLSQWIVKIDSEKKIMFSALNSSYSNQYLPEKLLTQSQEMHASVVFYDRIKYYTQSTAIIKVFIAIGGIWNIVRLCYIFPKFIRDWMYQRIAKNRNKLFGRSDVCLIEHNIFKERVIK